MIHRQAVCCLALILLCLNISGWGQVLPSIEVTPLDSIVELAPGQAHNGSFRVTNRGDKPVSLRVLLKDFVLDEEGGLFALEPGSTGDHSLANYITYTPESMVLEPGESQHVSYSFSLPADATGPHWATLIVRLETASEAVAQPGKEGIALQVRFQINFAFVIIHYCQWKDGGWQEDADGPGNIPKPI